MTAERYEGVDVDALRLQALDAAKIGQVDHECGPDDLAPRLPDQLDGGLRRAARRNQVVNDEDALPSLDGLLVDLDGIDAVLERVLLTDRLPRQLALLAHRDEAAAQAVGHRAAQDEAAGLDAGDRVHSRTPIR